MVRNGCKGADIVENGNIETRRMIQQSASMYGMINYAIHSIFVTKKFLMLIL